jgi:predicted 3-demethylubiquinone-9 3-methyltransferase (glyoxalase superfamily)
VEDETPGQGWITQTEYCYRHPTQATRVHCTRCSRPICTDCMIPAPVGYQCPECVAEARRAYRQGPAARVRSMRSTSIVAFRLDGQAFVALNGGPEFHFTEAVSFLVSCETQDEVDGFWEQLSECGEQGPCGWLKDRYGLSWQIVPSVLTEMLQDDDPTKAERVMAAMLQMKKIEIDGLRRAYEQQ